MPYPIDVQFARQGLVVYDYAQHRLHVLDAATGRERFAVGRRGPGPAAFGDRPVWLFGTWSRPMAVEFSGGRVTALLDDKLQSVRTAHSDRWATACAWGEDKVILTTSGHEVYDHFISTIGETAQIVDSIAAPWPSYRTNPHIVRQGEVRQVDDSTCAIPPLYQNEFALVAPIRPPRLGVHIETLPEAKGEFQRTSKMRIASLAKGARPGARDVRAWRDYVLVLFDGTTAHRLRIFDVYDRQTLRYRGSTRLPFEATRFGVDPISREPWYIIRILLFAPHIGSVRPQDSELLRHAYGLHATTVCPNDPVGSAVPALSLAQPKGAVGTCERVDNGCLAPGNVKGTINFSLTKAWAQRLA